MTTELVSPSPVLPIKSQGFYSFTVTIDNDTAYSWTPPVSYGHVLVSSSSVNGHGMSWFRSSSTAKLGGSINFDCVNTALTGTTGIITHVTLGVSGGTLYLENRAGSVLELTVTLFSPGAHK